MRIGPTRHQDHRRSRGVAAAAGAVAAALSLAMTGPATATPSGPAFTPGAQSVGDSWFPSYGNGGYDALHYDIRMSFQPRNFTIDGRTEMLARATKDLSRFSVDLDGLTVSSVRVDGRRATYVRHGHKLVCDAPRGLPEGRRFRLVVAYSGRPRPVGSGPTQTGFLRTNDGAFTLTNDIASDTWFPNNDHPLDKSYLPHAGDRAARADRRGQRTTDRQAPRRRPRDLHVERAEPDGQLPRNRRHRQVADQDRPHPGRRAHIRGRRPATRQDRPHNIPTRCRSSTAPPHRSPTTMRRSSGRTHSAPPAPSPITPTSTANPSATRKRPRPAPSTAASSTPWVSRTRWPTSGSGTASRSPTSPTSG